MDAEAAYLRDYDSKRAAREALIDQLNDERDSRPYEGSYTAVCDAFRCTDKAIALQMAYDAVYWGIPALSTCWKPEVERATADIAAAQRRFLIDNGFPVIVEQDGVPVENMEHYRTEAEARAYIDRHEGLISPALLASLKVVRHPTTAEQRAAIEAPCRSAIWDTPIGQSFERQFAEEFAA